MNLDLNTTEKNFGILANSKMFNILSSKIYTDKYLAPVRELSCNAYDAHVAAGKKEVPIRVHVPVDGEYYFEVEDFGTGMSSEEIEHLYTTYGASSKMNSNEQIGCLGLGSKSPFAYTNRFIVRSRKDGREVQYQCYIEDGFPKLAKVYDEETDQPSGTAVNFPVNSYDRERFCSACEQFFRNFSPRPVFNVNIDFENAIVFNHGIAQSKDRTSYVLMGNVLYRYSSDVIDDEYRGFQNKFGYYTAIQAEIGDIDITVSREAVEMTAKSKKFIYEKHLQAQREIVEEMRSTRPNYKRTYDYIKMLGEYCGKYRFISSDLFLDEVKNYVIYHSDSNFDYLKITSSRWSKSESRNNETRKEFRLISEDYQREGLFIFCENGSLRGSAVISDWLHTNSDSRFVYLFSDKGLKEALEKEGFEVHDRKEYDIPRSHSVSVSTGKKYDYSLDGYKTLSPSRYEKYGMTLTNYDRKEQLDVLFNAEKVYYIHTDGRDLHDSEQEKLSDAGFDRLSELYNIIRKPQDGIIVGLNNYRYGQLKNNPHFHSLTDWIIENYNKESEGYAKFREFFRASTIQNHLYSFFKKIDLDEVPPQFKSVYDALHNTDSAPEEYSTYYHLFSSYYDKEKAERDADSYKEWLFSQFPMLSFCGSGARLSYILDYVELVKNGSREPVWC